MPPLRKVPPLGTRGREMAQVGDVVQAGRSESSLAVEYVDRQLRSSASAPTVVRENLESLRRSSPSPARQLGVPSEQHSPSRRTSYVPVVPSPLNPSSARSSTSSSEEGAHITTSRSLSDDLPSKTSTKIETTRRSQKRATSSLGPPQGMPKQKSMTSVQSAGSLRLGAPTRPETPKTLKDLGGDYSRYPRSRSTSTVRASLKPPNARSSLVGSAPPLLKTTTTNPFSDSQADLERFGYPDDSLGAFGPYYGGEKGFILYADEIEADDRFHMPQPDDDITYKPKLSEYFEKKQVVSTVGGILLVMGLLCVFIVFPVLSYTTRSLLPKGGEHYDADTGPAWAHVNNNTYPLLGNVRKGLIDPDTPTSAMTRKSTFDGSTLNLVFSDEFNENNRTFYPGDDPFWTAPDIWYGSTQDMEWYDPDAVTTGGGTLQLRVDSFPNHGLQWRSGMLNSWNQLCFKGGVFEVSVSLAGPSGVPGLWPGVWTLGNLARPGYRASSDGVWPYTYDSCDYGITPNQSAPDGLSYLPGQKLSTCSCKGADHPSPGTGRGAPEIDILEASVDPINKIGVVTQSFQVAPFDVFWRPNSDFMAIPNYETTSMNAYTGGPYQQAISGTSLLNNAWYDGKSYQKYAFEYIPGTSKGKIAWFVGEDSTFIMDGRAIGANGNVAARQVSEEPMSMILNLGMSGSWSQILMGELKFPTVMHIDYVRIYQPKGKTSITCDPPGYPTTEYIKQHPIAYQNPNLTKWEETGYEWPKNKLTGC